MSFKVGVYTIAKNEIKHVDRWVKSMKEADEIVVLDTGSTDGTVERLRSHGVKVEVGVFKPWRFDFPRNASMHLLSPDVDICVCTDLDEILTVGWRKSLEKSWVPGVNCRVRYNYTWNWNPDGSPGITFFYEKIHGRNGYRWVKPVHEILQTSDPALTERFVYNHEFQLHHHADATKSRSNYLPLLELSVKEEPYDDRNSHYLGREYMYYGMWDKAILELWRHLSLPRAKWMPERAASMRYMAKCFVMKKDYLHAQEWALKACAEDPNGRETWLQLARVNFDMELWDGVIYACTQCLAIKERPNHYINEPDAWGNDPIELLANAYVFTHQFKKADVLKAKLAEQA
jgi:glycosyltransferase involved in cell wall biosynthesis